jgi:pimeloyl-ACP methyl ester carboxylesterase
MPDESALYVADALPVRGVVALAGVCDLRRAWELRLSDNVTEQLLGGTPGEVPDRYAAASPADLLPLGTPQVLVHGTSDSNVPYTLSADYAARAAAAGDEAELVPLPGAGHFEIVDPHTPEWAIVQNATLRLLDLP